MSHQHIYDENGKQLCCMQEEKIYTQAGAEDLLKGSSSSASHDHKHKNDHGHTHDHDHDHDHSGTGTTMQLFTPAIISFILLIAGISMDNWIRPEWFPGWPRIIWYLVAYLPVGLPVIKEAAIGIRKGEVFSEFFLMSIATLGAFAIREFPEAVAVMLFYAVGENFQTLAVRRAKTSIKTLLDQRPDEVTVRREGKNLLIKAEEALIGDVILLKPGEKLGLDGELLSESASFNTAALTGESKPDTKRKNDVVLAGMINLNSASEVKVTTAYTDSKLSKILELVENATSQKAPTELFIRKFARIYTPVVVFLAAAICLLPYFFVSEYIFSDWLYRSLIFLVISCPCALVISIPLGYFGGIGAASKHGILFKGSNFLDLMAEIRHIVTDKTGTMTKGVFAVQEVVFTKGMDKDQLLQLVNVLENHSSHPVATAIHEYVGAPDEQIRLDKVEEIPGHGLKAEAAGKLLLAGNFRLMEKFGISHDVNVNAIPYTIIAVAYDHQFAGYITIADSIKEDARQAIDELHALGVKVTMLSGDKSSVVAYVAAELGIDDEYGDLLPEDKVFHVKEIRQKDKSVAFVGDGINDAPVVALSDVGIAMGGLGSDATIETADVVIQDDKPSKIPLAIRIGKQTKKIVWQNIALAFGVKAIVLILGAGGLATMWEAVFADVGVALLAILNAIRIQRMNFYL